MPSSPTTTYLRPPRFIAPAFLIVGLLLSGLLWAYRIHAFTPMERANLVHYGVSYFKLGPQSTDAAMYGRATPEQRNYWGYKWRVYNGRNFPALFERCAIASGVLLFGFVIAGVLLQQRAKQRWLEPRHVRGKRLLAVKEYNNLKIMRKGSDGMYIRLAKMEDQ